MTKPRNCRSRILCLGLLVQLMPALRTGACRMVVDFQRKYRLPPRKRHLPRLPRQKFRHMPKMCARDSKSTAHFPSCTCASRCARKVFDASRAVFGKARKDKWTTWEVFESAALMEYHVANQLGVADKIFGLAHARFPDEVDFVVAI
ncbi:hypothetical protein DFH11DRAFT_259491 [Phellopilus nigrolimitatus]|nr:hypothetical protein DFH11DRAFT_259491 [Phellopilus nigrolimitatus]